MDGVFLRLSFLRGLRHHNGAAALLILADVRLDGVPHHAVDGAPLGIGQEPELFVNLRSGICRADFCKGSRDPYKSRWYDTIGKRTFNAISETVRNAGFAI